MVSSCDLHSDVSCLFFLSRSRISPPGSRSIGHWLNKHHLLLRLLTRSSATVNAISTHPLAHPCVRCLLFWNSTHTALECVYCEMRSTMNQSVKLADLCGLWWSQVFHLMRILIRFRRNPWLRLRSRKVFYIRFTTGSKLHIRFLIASFWYKFEIWISDLRSGKGIKKMKENGLMTMATVARKSSMTFERE